MVTYNMQLDDTITPLLNWFRSLELRSAKVYRRREPDRVIYAGDATLTYDPLGSGSLVTHIKLTEPFPTSEISRAMNGYPIGKLVSDDAYLTMELTDTKGNLWTDEATSDVGHNLTLYDGLGEVYVGSRSLSTSYSMPHQENHVYQVVLANRLAFDFPDFELVPGVLLHVDPFTSFTRLMLISDASIPQSLARELTEALQTLTGRRLQWIFELYQHGPSTRITLWSVDKPLKERGLPTPIPKHEGAALIQFVQRFFKRHIESDDYVLHWHSIYNAWQVSLVTAVLPLSVSVEALINAYFSHEKVESGEAKVAVDKALAMIDQLDVSDEHRKRLRNSIANIANPSVTRALKSIAEKGGLTRTHVQAYTKIRNRAAHGVATSLDSAEEMDEFMAKVFSCLSLFYKLLLLHLNFEGPIQDQSQEKFPIINMSSERYRAAC